MYYQAESELGLNFLKTLPAHNESLVFSPISIALVLSLVHTGALGNTKKQIEEFLLDKSKCNNCQFVNHFSKVYKDLKKMEMGIFGVEVNMANRLYMKNGSTAKRTFLSAISQNYGAEVRAVHFGAPEAIQNINDYVKTATKDKIQQILTIQDSISSAQDLLINAISFGGRFEKRFSYNPVKQLFYKNDREGVLKNVLSDDSIRGYASDDIFQVVTLKYVDPRFRLVIFLPKRNNGLNDALKKLDNRRFKNLLDNLKPTSVYTEIPGFSINYRISFKRTLTTIGITEIFSDFANLSGISDNVKISEGIHKSVFDVSSFGTGINCTNWDPLGRPESSAQMPPAECMSNTIGSFVPTVPSANSVHFKANHPFLFALTYLKHNVFMGFYRG